MRWLGILLVLASVAPTVAGQSFGQFKPNLDLRFDDKPTEPLVAGGPPGAIDVHWTYTFKEATTSTLAQDGGRTTIHFTPAPACAYSGLSVTGPESVAVVFGGPAPATRGVYEGVARFNVSAASTAPRETPIPCMFSAVVDPVNSQITGAQAAPINLTVGVAPDAASCSDCATKASPAPVVFPVLLLLGVAVQRRRRLHHPPG